MLGRLCWRVIGRRSSPLGAAWVAFVRRGAVAVLRDSWGSFEFGARPVFYAYGWSRSIASARLQTATLRQREVTARSRAARSRAASNANPYPNRYPNQPSFRPRPAMFADVRI